MGLDITLVQTNVVEDIAVVLLEIQSGVDLVLCYG